MDVLLILGGLLVALVVAGWSCARSYFENGRLRGAEEATREILHGIASHYELLGQAVPESVAKALKAVYAVSKRRKMGAASTDPYHARFWISARVIEPSRLRHLA